MGEHRRCDDAVYELYTFLDGELTDQRRAEIRRHLDDCPPEWDGVTLHHLLTHTSGIEIDNLWSWIINHVRGDRSDPAEAPPPSTAWSIAAFSSPSRLSGSAPRRARSG